MAHSELANVRQYMGQFSRAHLHYELALKDPEWFNPNQGYLFLKEDDFENAIKIADEGLPLAKSKEAEANFCNLKAEAFLMKRDIGEAERLYQKLLSTIQIHANPKRGYEISQSSKNCRSDLRLRIWQPSQLIDGEISIQAGTSYSPSLFNINVAIFFH